MGNGPRITNFGSDVSVTLDVSGTLTLTDLENASATALANFGKPMFFGIPTFAGHYERYPEYTGTPWSDLCRLTKREKAIAGLHTTLNKLQILNKIEDKEFGKITQLSIRRLKRAKWAKYQQKVK